MTESEDRCSIKPAVAEDRCSIKPAVAEDRCSICGSEYEEPNHPRYPTNPAKRSLWCKHSFCYPCLKTCVLGDKLYCNLCGYESSLHPITQNWQIFVKSVASEKTLSVNVHAEDPISLLFQRIGEEIEVAPLDCGGYSFKLIFAGKLLDDQSSLPVRTTGLSSCSTVHFLHQLRGD